MDTFEAIYQRRAVKHYDPEHEFTDDEIQKLMEAAIQAPTSFNMQNWRFVSGARQVAAAGDSSSSERSSASHGLVAVDRDDRWT